MFRSKLILCRDIILYISDWQNAKSCQHTVQKDEGKTDILKIVCGIENEAKTTEMNLEIFNKYSQSFTILSRNPTTRICHENIMPKIQTTYIPSYL